MYPRESKHDMGSAPQILVNATPRSCLSYPRAVSSNPTMSATFKYNPASQLCELTISGLLNRADLAAAEAEMARRIDSGERPRVLVLIENFGGWQPGDDWNNLDFMFSYGAKIAKIAIVGAGAKQDEVKAFTGAGLRPTPVEFFADAEVARTWLAESSK